MEVGQPSFTHATFCTLSRTPPPSADFLPLNRGMMDRRYKGVAMMGSRVALFLILLCLQRMVEVKATEMSSIRKEEERQADK